MGGPLRRANIEEALKVPKSHLRRWLESLEPLRSRDTQARKASYYSRADLGFLFVVKMLVDAGLDIEQIQPISQQLYNVIAKPAGTNIQQVVRLHFSKEWKLSGTPAPESLQLDIPVWAASAAADAYWVGGASPQHVINLGVTAIGPRPRTVNRG